MQSLLSYNFIISKINNAVKHPIKVKQLGKTIQSSAKTTITSLKAENFLNVSLH